MVHNPLLRLLTPGRIRRISVAVLLALTLSAAIAWAIDHSAQGMARRGDFPAFYAAAQIVLNGQGEDLYRAELQAQVENRYWPGLEGRYLSFAYPPYVGLLAAPFGYLAPAPAKILFSALMLSALFGAAKGLIKSFPKLQGQTLAVFTSLLAFGPVYAGTLGGQNTALSMLLYFTAAGLILENTRSADLKAGICIGLWSFKPHFCFVALLFAAAAGRGRIILGAVLPLLLAYVGGIVVLNDVLWPLSWVEAVKDFAVEDLQENGHQMVSLPAVLSQAGRNSDLPLLLLGYVLSGCLLLTLLYRLRSTKQNSGLYLASVIGPAAVFLSPHTLFYDSGLCLFFLFYLALELGSPAFLRMLLLYVTAFAACLLREEFTVQPLMLLGAFLTIYLARGRGEEILCRRVNH